MPLRPERSLRDLRDGADTWPPYIYDADGVSEHEAEELKQWNWKRRPAIHMPRWASREWLEVEELRAQRLLNISEADARAEGLSAVTKDGTLYKWGIPDRDGCPGTDDFGWPWCDWDVSPQKAFFHLWDSIHGKGAAEKNPTVWIYQFRRIERPDTVAEQAQESLHG